MSGHCERCFETICICDDSGPRELTIVLSLAKSADVQRVTANIERMPVCKIIKTISGNALTKAADYESALKEISTFPRYRMPAEIAKESLSKHKEQQ